eukprot:454992_1
MTELSEQKVNNMDGPAGDVDEKSMVNNNKCNLWMCGTIGFAVTTLVFMVLFIIYVTNTPTTSVVYEPIGIEVTPNDSIHIVTQSGNIIMTEQGTSLLLLPDKSAQGIELKNKFPCASKTNVKVVPEYVTYTYNRCDLKKQPWLEVWSGMVFTANKNLIRVDTNVIVPYPPSGPKNTNMNWTFEVWNLGMQPTGIGPSIGINNSYQDACSFQGANDTSYINSGHFYRLIYGSNTSRIPKTFNNPIDQSSLYISGQWLWTESLELAQTPTWGYASFMNRSTYGRSVHTSMIEQSNEVWVTTMELNDPVIVNTLGFNQSLLKNVLQYNYAPGSFQHDLLYNNSWKFGMVPYFYQSIVTQPETVEDIPRFWPNVTRYTNVSFEVEDNAGLSSNLMYSPEITGKLFDGHLFLNNNIMDEYVNASEKNATSKFPFQKCVAACVNAWANGMIVIYHNDSDNVYDAIVRFENSVASTQCASGVCRVDPLECTLSYWSEFCILHQEYDWCLEYT